MKGRQNFPQNFLDIIQYVQMTNPQHNITLSSQPSVPAAVVVRAQHMLAAIDLYNEATL